MDRFFPYLIILIVIAGVIAALTIDYLLIFPTMVLTACAWGWYFYYRNVR